MARWPWTVNHLSLGHVEEAHAFFATTNASVLGDFRQWTEFTGGGGCPNFLTGAGGYLQQLWAGYAGIRMEDDGLRMTRPRCPPSTSALVISGLAFGGSRIRVQIVCHSEETKTARTTAKRQVYVRLMDEQSPHKRAFQTLWARGPAGVTHTLSTSGDIEFSISDNTSEPESDAEIWIGGE